MMHESDLGYVILDLWKLDVALVFFRLYEEAGNKAALADAVSEQMSREHHHIYRRGYRFPSSRKSTSLQDNAYRRAMEYFMVLAVWALFVVVVGITFLVDLLKLRELS